MCTVLMLKKVKPIFPNRIKGISKRSLDYFFSPSRWIIVYYGIIKIIYYIKVVYCIFKKIEGGLRWKKYVKNTN